MGIPIAVRADAASVPVTFDAEAFVDDLLAAGCHVAVHQPIGPDARAAFWIVYPADLDGTPTEGEREVRARWAATIAACPDADARILAVCRKHPASTAGQGCRVMSASSRASVPRQAA
jgi:hypothetical protein